MTRRIEKRLVVKILGAALVAVSVSGCTEPYERYSVQEPHYNYAQYGIMRLDVAKVAIDDQFVPTLRTPYVEHEAPLPLYRAVHQWADSRFQAIGTGGEARVIIKEASIKKETLVIERDGVQDWTDSDKYTARVVLRVDIDSPYYAPDSYGEVTVEKSSSLPNTAGLPAREHLYNHLTKQVLDTLNAEIAKSLRKNVPAVVR